MTSAGDEAAGDDIEVATGAFPEEPIFSGGRIGGWSAAVSPYSPMSEGRSALLVEGFWTISARNTPSTTTKDV